LNDLDGSPAGDVQTILFGVDGCEYEIDLSAHNAAMLREVIASYAAAARRSAGEPIPGRGGSACQRWPSVPGLAPVGMPVADRGRIAKEVRRRYEAETALPFQQVLVLLPR